MKDLLVKNNNEMETSSKNKRDQVHLHTFI